MNIIICGAGEVGFHAAEMLSTGGHNVTVVDRSNERVRVIEDSLDVRTLVGNAADAMTIREAGGETADLVVAATDSDEINLLTASIAKAVGTRKSIARVHHSSYFEEHGLNYREHLGIDQLICPEFSTASAIARTLRNPAAFAIEAFGRGKIEMQEFPVSQDAKALDRPLSQLRLPLGARLAAVARGGDVFVPVADTTVQKGDRVVLVGNADVFYEARALFQREAGGKQKIVIMGGAPMTVWVCRALRDRNWSIRVFETNRARAVELAEKLDWITVLQADPTDRGVFAEEQLALADVFLGLLSDDEANIIGGVLAKSMGVTQVMVVVQKPNYMDLLYHIGVDRLFSPRMVAAREIENVLDERPLRQIASLAEGYVDAYRIRAPASGEAIRKPLFELGLTPHWMVAAIRRNERVWVPAANDQIESGDTVLVVGKAGEEKHLKRLFNV